MKTRETVIVVGVIAALSWWLLSSEQQKETARLEGERFIDAFMNRFTLTAIDDSGKLSYTLRAERLEHYNDEKRSIITKPVIDIPQDESSWNITADFGEINNDQTKIFLKDNVIMTKMGTGDDTPLELRTKNISIDTEAQTIEGKQTVKIRDGSLNLVSIGMHLDNANKRLTLLSDVKGRYVR